ncbi:MAG: hypothetical protein ABL958_11275 [Bdellovibrionia bacterium]
MDLESFFGWYFAHNTLLINAVIVAILALIALALFFSLSKKGGDATAAVNGSIDELEKTLRRVLDSVPVKIAGGPSATGLIQDEDDSKQGVQAAAAHAAAAEFQSMVETLKKDVGEKDKVIQTLKSDIEKVASTGGLTEEQKQRIAALERELEMAKSRLSEYEIIEDDIANLSLYKAENTQLKSELDKMRRVKVIKDDPSSIPQVSDIVAEFAAIVGAEDNPKVPPKTGPSAAPKAAAAPAPAPVQASAPAPAAAPVAAEPKEGGGALDIDASKLIAEAAALPEGEADSAEEGKEEDSKQKLINEFESFIKNG